MTARPAGFLEIILVVLLLIWFLGVTVLPAGAGVHVLLAIVVIVLLLRMASS